MSFIYLNQGSGTPTNVVLTAPGSSSAASASTASAEGSSTALAHPSVVSAMGTATGSSAAPAVGTMRFFGTLVYEYDAARPYQGLHGP